MNRRARRKAGPSTLRGHSKRAKGEYVFVLYVTGSSALSMRAVQNLRGICDDYLAGNHSLEIVDLYSNPDLASSANVIASPTMVKSLPLPVERFVGDMSDRKSILARLKIQG